jgi:hypothetical protein
VGNKFRGIDLVRFFQARLLEASTPDLSPIIDQFKYLPSHLSALSIFGSLRGEVLPVTFSTVLLLLLLVVALILYVFVRPQHLKLWQKAGENSFRNFGISRMLTFRTIQNATSRQSVILRKEFAIFFRDGKGLLWILFISLLWLFQILSAKVLVHGLAADRVATSAVPGMVGLLEFAVILYFISLFVLRFAFPTFSTEQKTSWIFRTAPIDLRNVFVAKLVFFVLLFCGIAAVFTFLSSISMGLALPLNTPYFFGVITATCFLTSFALMLSARYPNHETDDAEQLSTSIPGIGFIFGALVYGFIGAAAFASFVSSGVIGYYVLFLLLSIVGVLYFVRVARTALISFALN